MLVLTCYGSTAPASCLWSTHRPHCFGRRAHDQDNCATFTYYPIVQHTEAFNENEYHAGGAATGGGALGVGTHNSSSTTGGALPAAEEKITTLVATGTYEDRDLSYDVREHSQMHVRVGVLHDLVERGLNSTGKLKLLDLLKVSGNKILVLREPRLKLAAQFQEELDWPCSADNICELRQCRTNGAAPTPG